MYNSLVDSLLSSSIADEYDPWDQPGQLVVILQY
jgi:hypothetical protein